MLKCCFHLIKQLTSPECLSLWIQHWNFLVICLALTYNGMILIIRELLLGLYIILGFFLAWGEKTLWQGINSSFYPIPLTGWRSLSLSAEWLSSLFFHPCFPPILHTRAWVRESDTLEKRGEGGETVAIERRETNWERKRERWRDSWSEEGRVDRYLG